MSHTVSPLNKSLGTFLGVLQKTMGLDFYVTMHGRYLPGFDETEEYKSLGTTKEYKKNSCPFFAKGEIKSFHTDLTVRFEKDSNFMLEIGLTSANNDIAVHNQGVCYELLGLESIERFDQIAMEYGLNPPFWYYELSKIEGPLVGLLGSATGLADVKRKSIEVKTKNLEDDKTNITRKIVFSKYNITNIETEVGKRLLDVNVHRKYRGGDSEEKIETYWNSLINAVSDIEAVRQHRWKVGGRIVE